MKPALTGPPADTYRCRLCEDTHWVCEQHPDRPWSGMELTPSACPDGCAGPGEACPLCHPFGRSFGCRDEDVANIREAARTIEDEYSDAKGGVPLRLSLALRNLADRIEALPPKEGA